MNETLSKIALRNPLLFIVLILLLNGGATTGLNKFFNNSHEHLNDDMLLDMHSRIIVLENEVKHFNVRFDRYYSEGRLKSLEEIQHDLLLHIGNQGSNIDSTSIDSTSDGIALIALLENSK